MRELNIVIMAILDKLILLSFLPLSLLLIYLHVHVAKWDSGPWIAKASLNFLHSFIFLKLCLVVQSCLTLCDMDCSPPGSSFHGDSPGKNTGVGCHFLLQFFKLAYLYWSITRFTDSTVTSSLLLGPSTEVFLFLLLCFPTKEFTFGPFEKIF